MIDRFTDLIFRTEKKRFFFVNLRKAISCLSQMQDMFTAINTEHGLSSQQYEALCEKEEKSLNDLMLTCLYYDVHQPSQYFSKYDIKRWYSEEHKKRMIQVSRTFELLSSLYRLILPNKCYFEEILSHLPIIITDSFDMTNEHELSKLFLLCLPFSELDFDYLVLLSLNENQNINATGIKISKSFFKEITNQDNDSFANNTPFPIEITQKVLDCFDDNYQLEKPQKPDLQGVDRIGELLWELSMYQVEQKTSQTADEYLDQICVDLKAKIISLLESFKPKLSKELFTEIEMRSNSVINGAEFSDEMLDSFIELIISHSMA